MVKRLQEIIRLFKKKYLLKKLFNDHSKTSNTRAEIFALPPVG